MDKSNIVAINGGTVTEYYEKNGYALSIGLLLRRDPNEATMVAYVPRSP